MKIDQKYSHESLSVFQIGGFNKIIKLLFLHLPQKISSRHHPIFGWCLELMNGFLIIVPPLIIIYIMRVSKIRFA